MLREPDLDFLYFGTVLRTSRLILIELEENHTSIKAIGCNRCREAETKKIGKYYDVGRGMVQCLIGANSTKLKIEYFGYDVTPERH